MNTLRASKGQFSSWLMIALVLLAISNAPPVGAQTDCRWDGTAPFCDGECKAGESEITRLSELGGGYPPFYYGPEFGKACATGSKALCCKTPGLTCRWDGTAPFCDGECGPGEKQVDPPAGSSGGKACVSGSKVYCCHATGSASSSLQANPELTRYAAIWVKFPRGSWQARHGLSSSQFQETFDKLVAQGYRLVEIDGYSVGGKARYAAIWSKTQGPAWAARHGMTSTQYQDEFDKLAKQGYRPVRVSGFDVGGKARYAAIWEKSSGVAWVARHGLTSAQYQEAYDNFVQQGYRLVDVSGYRDGGKDRYAAIWEKSPGPAFVARHGMTSAKYQKEFNELAKKGYRPSRISSWRSGTSGRFAVIWVKTGAGGWVARHGMLSDAYQEEFDHWTKQGYRLVDISGYHTYD